MGLEVYWLQLAENKFDGIYYSVKAGKRITKKLINGIVDTRIGIDKQLEIGQIEFALKHRNEDFRYLVFKNYKIVYRVDYTAERIEIANVFDTRQNPGKLQEMDV